MPVYDLEHLKDGVANGTIRLRISQERLDKLIEYVGDDYEDYVRQVCSELTPTDYVGPWPQENPVADVYGIMRDILGGHSDEEYAWYVKFGPLHVGPGECIMSFHPSRDIYIPALGFSIKTTVDSYYEDEDDC